MKKFRDCLGNSIGPRLLPGPGADITFRKNIPIFPVELTHAPRMPLYLRPSADEFMEHLLKNGVCERVRPGDPPEEWLLSAFYIRKNPRSDKARLVINAAQINQLLERPIFPFVCAADVLSEIFCVSRYERGSFLSSFN